MALTPDEIRAQLTHLMSPRDAPGYDARLASVLQIEATLLLVEAVERLNASAALTAKCLDYLTDNLHEVGRAS